MKENAGVVFRIAEKDAPVPGCTVSRSIWQTPEYMISHFALAAGTSISPESYRYPMLWICLWGDLLPLDPEKELPCSSTEPDSHFSKPQVVLPGEAFLSPVNRLIGSATENGCVYTSIKLKEDTSMNLPVHAGDIFALKDLVPYQEDKIINMDLIHDEKLKLVIMSFDEGTSLPEHAAPGEALIFALDGEAIIGYKGKEHRIHAGENFKFDKGGAHFVTADHRFKMALLLTLD